MAFDRILMNVIVSTSPNLPCSDRGLAWTWAQVTEHDD